MGVRRARAALEALRSGAALVERVVPVRVEKRRGEPADRKRGSAGRMPNGAVRIAVAAARREAIRDARTRRCGMVRRSGILNPDGQPTRVVGRRRVAEPRLVVGLRRVVRVLGAVRRRFPSSVRTTSVRTRKHVPSGPVERQLEPDNDRWAIAPRAAYERARPTAGERRQTAVAANRVAATGIAGEIRDHARPVGKARSPDLSSVVVRLRRSSKRSVQCFDTPLRNRRASDLR
jgi:hypothetical protein